VVFKPLRDPLPVLELVAAWRRDDTSSNLQSFLEVVRELAPGQTPSPSANRPILEPRPPTTLSEPG
jgi:hypothetical protein